MKKSEKVIWDKLILNCFYEVPLGTTTFLMYDQNIKNQVTKDGKKNLKILYENQKNIIRD